jgi:hypothetical protein
MTDTEDPSYHWMDQVAYDPTAIVTINKIRRALFMGHLSDVSRLAAFVGAASTDAPVVFKYCQRQRAGQL